MAITALDTRTALIVIDLQKSILAYPTIQPTAEIVAQVSVLIAGFRRHALPIVFVNVTGGAPGRTQQPRSSTQTSVDAADILPELQRQPEDYLVTKRTWGAFTDTDLDAYLTRHQVTQVVIAGIATSIGVESTARHAYELGYNVTLAIDAMTDMFSEAHGNSITRIFPRLGETGTVQEIIDFLDNTFV